MTIPLHLTSPRRAVLYGTAIWLLAFAVSAVIFPLRTANRPLFESIMPVALVVLVVAFSVRCLRVVEQATAREGAVVGLLWLLVSLVIDLALFIPPCPMPMSPTAYVADIGVTYLLIPVVPVDVGYYAESLRAPS